MDYMPRRATAPAPTMANTKGWHFTTGPYPDNLRFGDIPVKKEPGPEEILVRVKAAAVNPVDIQLMNMSVWPYLPASYAPAVKGTGKDFAGVVEAAGKDTGWKAGDEIFGLKLTLTEGTMQELIIVDTSSSAIARKPSGWSWNQAAALPLVYLTARTTISSVGAWVTSGKKVVVLGGSSAVGMYAVHLAAARGWHVVASCSGRNADFVRSMGASEIIDYTDPGAATTSDPARQAAVPAGRTLAERVKGFAPEAIIDCVGGTECIGLARRYVTIVGDKTSRSSMGGTMTYLWDLGMNVRHWLGTLGLGKSYACVNLEVSKDFLEETLGLEEEKIVIDSVHQFGFGREAFERLNTGRARGKVVVEIGT